MNMKRIICALLTLVTVVSLIPVTVQPVSAARADKVDAEGNPLIDYLHTAYETPEAKLADMVLVKDQNGHQLWYEEFTGEVAFVDKASGQILFSNPWDVAAPYNDASDATKQELLSQLVITYVENGAEKKMNSYKDSALRGQIVKKNIKNGIRVEYTIGEEQTTRLVPRVIEKSRFEEVVLGGITEEYYRRSLSVYYVLYDPNDPDITDAELRRMYAAYPITEQGVAVYVCQQNINQRELKHCEEIITQWCPDYTYEELDYDHRLTGYVGQDAAPPLFKMAIEYTITESGDLEARLPANGIRFDESAFTLKGIALLPYMGAGANEYTGYTFVPDGSGTLVRFEDLKGTGYNISGQMYGADYAYHTLSNQHTEIMRWPVFGTVTNYDRKTYEETEEAIYVRTHNEDQGFFAIITEGDSQATLKGEYGGSLHCFNTVFAQFNPRPSDQYNLAESISQASNAMWSVESDRKYTGSYRVLYKMLTDDAIADEKGIADAYSADYVGMAEAYRDYLTDTGALTLLADTTENIPLYIESFGSIETTERILSFPVQVDTPLTTFEDIKTMYEELTEAGVGRLNFRLNGFHNGGMFPTVPYKLKWMDVLGGGDGFTELLTDATEAGVGIFPDFDFVYVQGTEFADGLSLRKHAVKTIDDRYTSKRYYDAATQSFTSDFSLCLSASVFEYFYEGFNERYQKYDPVSISVSTLGSDLNSDFDEDDPYNREDSKEFTKDVLAKIDADYEQVMVDGGNAYVLPYVNHILNISTDSSRFLKASEAIPFVGMVLHGAKYIAGTPINMEGDVNSAVLKAIENGSSLYFTLSYQNTNRLKDFENTNKYYSVSYEIWKDDVVEYYTTLNDVTKDLQTSLIVDHEFLTGERIPDADEKAADEAALKAAEEAAKAAEEAEKRKEELEKEYENAMGHGYRPNTDDPFEYVETEPVETEPVETEPAEQPEEEPAEGETTEGTETEPVETEPVETEPEKEMIEIAEETEEKVVSKYTTAAGSIVRVEYEGGVNFLLNYNSFDITVNYNGQTYTIAALGFVRIG